MSRRLERSFTNSSEISRHLYCPICTEVFLDPTRLFCGHTFCKKCFTHWNKDHDTCPICRTEVHVDLVSKDIVADKIIQDLEVRCQNEECIWTDRLENLEKHSKICVFAKKPEWLTQDKNYIEINDDKTPLGKVPGNVQQVTGIPMNRRYMNIFDRVLTINPETQKFLEGFIIDNSPRPVIPTNNLIRQSTINNQSRHHPSFIEEQKEARRRRLHRDRENQTDNTTPEVIVPKREILSGQKDQNNKEQKTSKDEKAFFGVKSWLEVDGQAEASTGDDDLEIIMISSRTNNNTRRGSRRMRRNCQETIVINNNDNADVLVKKRKTM